MDDNIFNPDELKDFPFKGCSLAMQKIEQYLYFQSKKIDEMYKTVCGNGGEGLAESVRNNTTAINKLDKRGWTITARVFAVIFVIIALASLVLNIVK